MIGDKNMDEFDKIEEDLFNRRVKESLKSYALFGLEASALFGLMITMIYTVLYVLNA